MHWSKKHRVEYTLVHVMFCPKWWSEWEKHLQGWLCSNTANRRRKELICESDLFHSNLKEKTRKLLKHFPFFFFLFKKYLLFDGSVHFKLPVLPLTRCEIAKIIHYLKSSNQPTSIFSSPARRCWLGQSLQLPESQSFIRGEMRLLLHTWVIAKLLTW